jgi:signal transduction histidine kinase
MRQPLSFGTKLGAGFLVVIFSALSICAVAIYGLKQTVKNSHDVYTHYTRDVIISGKLRADEEATVASSRGYLITGKSLYLSKMATERSKFLQDLEFLRTHNDSPDQAKLLNEVKDQDSQYQKILARFIKSRSEGFSVRQLAEQFENEQQPGRVGLENSIDNFLSYTMELFHLERITTSKINEKIFDFLIIISTFAILLATALALIVTRTLSRLFAKSQNAAKVRQEIVEMVAHDLKNPISAINLTTDLMARSLEGQTSISSIEVRRRNEVIRKASDRMSSIVFTLLDLAKLEAGTFTIDKKKVLPSEILKNTFELFEPLAIQKKLKLEYSSDLLPDLECDGERIYQVLSNLLGNSLKFTKEKSKIIMNAQVKGEGIVFSVIDEGPGLSTSEMIHVFDRYWQADCNRKIGTGLGLAICKGIIESHNGKIWVESKLGEGSKFSFYIPFLEASPKIFD